MLLLRGLRLSLLFLPRLLLLRFCLLFLLLLLRFRLRFGLLLSLRLLRSLLLCCLLLRLLLDGLRLLLVIPAAIGILRTRLRIGAGGRPRIAIFAALLHRRRRGLRLLLFGIVARTRHGQQRRSRADRDQSGTEVEEHA